MSSLKQRLITTLVGIPALLIVIFLLPQFGHLAFALVATGFTILGSREIYRIIKLKYNIIPNLPYYLSGLIPLTAWLSNILKQDNLTDLIFVFLLILSLSLEIFRGAKEDKPFENSITAITVDSFALIYPGYLLSYIIKVNSFELVASYYALFLLCVFSNDIFAYLFGMAFGKNTRGFIKASPNKSIVGFVGGILSCIAISTFTSIILKLPLEIYQSVIIGAAISLSANIGDLIESVIKRSAHVKDSGALTPGRGGALDNLDSLITSAPLFYLLLELFIK